jgi:hypothetical protein
VNVWTIPEVRLAAEAILAAEQQVRLEHPNWTPHERIQEARARCVSEILSATMAIDLAELDASTRAVTEPKHETPWFTEYHRKLRPIVDARREERYERIRQAARLHPEWSRRELVEMLGITRSKVNAALRGSGIQMAGHNGGAPIGNQNGRWKEEST